MDREVQLGSIKGLAGEGDLKRVIGGGSSTLLKSVQVLVLCF